MSPTFSVAARAAREYARLNSEDRARFTVARKAFVEALRTDPSALPPNLRVKRVQARIWDLGADLGRGRARDVRVRRRAAARRAPRLLAPYRQPFDLVGPVDWEYL